jgi:hypothetical protein
VDRIDFYLQRPSGGWRVVEAGISRPLNPAMAVSRTPVLQLPPELPSQTVNLHPAAKQVRPGNAHFPARLSKFRVPLPGRFVYLRLLYGAPFALALFNLFVFFSLRDRVYIYYVIFILSLLAYQFILHGQAHILGLFSHEVGMALFGVMVGLALLFGASSPSHFFYQNQRPLLGQGAQRLHGLGLVRIGLSLVGFHALGNHLAQFMGL